MKQTQSKITEAFTRGFKRMNLAGRNVMALNGHKIQSATLNNTLDKSTLAIES